jgi:hypothetical protein
MPTPQDLRTRLTTICRGKCLYSPTLRTSLRPAVETTVRSNRSRLIGAHFRLLSPEILVPVSRALEARLWSHTEAMTLCSSFDRSFCWFEIPRFAAIREWLRSSPK